MVKEFKKFDLQTFQSRGYKLTPIELKDVIPFEVKRIYYITDFSAFGGSPPKADAPWEHASGGDGGRTGEHCHKIEEEVFVIVKGSCAAIIDCGKGLEEIKLNGPSDAIYVPNFLWHGFKDASSDCVILALSSTNYSPSREDYIEDYEEFKKISPYYHQG